MRIFTFGENPAFYHISQDSNSLRGSPTTRKYSLLFGGAYAPNDAIYRKRYAFTDALIKLRVFFGRFDQIKMPKTVDFTGFSAFFCFYVSSLKFEGDHITDHNKNFLSLKYKLDRRGYFAAVFHTD